MVNISPHDLPPFTWRRLTDEETSAIVPLFRGEHEGHVIHAVVETDERRTSDRFGCSCGHLTRLSIGVLEQAVSLQAARRARWARESYVPENWMAL